MGPCQALEVPLWRERSTLNIGIRAHHYINMLPPINKSYPLQRIVVGDGA